MFLGINMFLALLRAHFNPRYARAKMILSRAKNIFMPANINSIVIIIPDGLAVFVLPDGFRVVIEAVVVVLPSRFRVAIALDGIKLHNGFRIVIIFVDGFCVVIFFSGSIRVDMSSSGIEVVGTKVKRYAHEIAVN